MSLAKNPILTLALSGGGAKCAAEAGVLAVLEQSATRVGALAGVSAGGLVAVLYALGFRPAAIRDFIAETHLLELWEVDPARQGLLGTGKLRARLQSVVHEKTFADLTVPVTLVAADLKTGHEIHLQEGRLDTALLATMALPGILPPQSRNDWLLIDGGLVNPLPVDVARGLGECVVAIDLLGEADSGEPATQLFEVQGPAEFVTRLGRRLGLLSTIEVVHQAALIANRRVRDAQLRLYSPDLLLAPEVSRVGLFASDLAGYAYERGAAAAEAALPDIQRLHGPGFFAQLSANWHNRPGAGRPAWAAAKH